MDKFLNNLGGTIFGAIVGGAIGAAILMAAPVTLLAIFLASVVTVVGAVFGGTVLTPESSCSNRKSNSCSLDDLNVKRETTHKISKRLQQTPANSKTLNKPKEPVSECSDTDYVSKISGFFHSIFSCSSTEAKKIDKDFPKFERFHTFQKF